MNSLLNYKVRFFVLLLCIAITLPYPLKISNVFIILLLINWISQWKFTFQLLPLNILGFFFLLHISGLFYSSNMSQALFELEKKVSFLIFSIVISNSPLLDQKQFKILLLSFAVSCIIGSIICLGYSTFQLFAYGNTEYFFYHSLTEIIGMHAIYMAMYIGFSIFILIYYFGPDFSKRLRREKFLFFGILVYLLLFLFLLSARVVIVGFIIIVSSGLVLYGYKRREFLRMFFYSMLLIIISVGLVLFIPSNLERFKEAINYKSEYTIDKQYGGRSTRELIWSCSLKVIKENVLFGVGPGDTQDALQKCYRLDENKNWALLYRPDFQYNAHSQYLQTFIDLGILGILMFLAILVIPAIIAIKHNDYLLMSFVALFSLACITESMLELNKGIVFFSFFITIFLNRYSQGQIVRS